MNRKGGVIIYIISNESGNLYTVRMHDGALGKERWTKLCLER